MHNLQLYKFAIEKHININNIADVLMHDCTYGLFRWSPASHHRCGIGRAIGEEEDGHFVSHIDRRTKRQR